MTSRALNCLAAMTVIAVLGLACSTSSDTDPSPTVNVASVTPSTVGLPSATAVAGTPVTGPSPTRNSASSNPSPADGEPTLTRPAEPDGVVEIPLGDHSLTVPEGYSISVFAENLGAARFMALDADGVLYVTDRNGRVLRLPDVDGDGTADKTETVLDGLDGPHGITFHGGALYVAEVTRVIRATDEDHDGSFETTTAIVEDLPDKGHSTRTIRFGPDGKLYVAIGSSCNVCEETDPRRAAVWRYNADGSGGELFASGLRNAVGLAFDAATGLLWATNNGRDGMGNDVPPETINQLNQGDDFGWPRCHAGDIIDPQFGTEDACVGVKPPAVRMQAHSAPLGLTFVSGAQLPAFEGDLLVAFHGSWNRDVPTGYKVVRIPFEDGTPTGEALDFVTGWMLPDGDRWGRPVDVLIAADGSLMISDDEGGRIFRLARTT